MDKQIDPTLIGNILLDRGFEDWFRYLFPIIEHRPFIKEPLHEDLFAVFEDIIHQRTIRQIINLPPRSCKTDMCKYFVVYALTKNPASNWIYSSYSQALLNQIAQQIAAILEHPAYKAMYPVCTTTVSDEDVRPLDEWWLGYMKRQTQTNTYTARKITTYAGGTLLFAAAGSQITGFGAGIRNYEGFSGGVILDDFDKPADILSETMRNKNHTYISQTLLSRLNNSNVFFGCIAQRLHIDDTSGFLKDTYGFKVLSKPLLAADGTCQLPSQYTPERLIELQKDNYAWQAQYMQEPYMLGGGVFKLHWFRYYQDTRDTPYRRIYITADTACKTNEWNDFTAIGVWGITSGRSLRLLDFVHGKFEIPELLNIFTALWEKWKSGIGSCRCSAIYIEDKASGTQVIQTLRRKGGMPILPLTPQKDKLTRALDAVPQIAAGNVELPVSESHPLSKEILGDILAFSADMSHRHDDSVDCMLYAIDVAFNSRGYF